MSDYLTAQEEDRAATWTGERDSVIEALEENRARRERAEGELRAARDGLTELLARGQAVALDVAAMARTAAISRDTAHRLLREAGSLSWREKHRLAAAAGVPQGDARGAWIAEFEHSE